MEGNRKDTFLLFAWELQNVKQDDRYIIYIFRAIVLIFVTMFIITFRPLYSPAIFRWLKCRTLPFIN